MTFSAKYDEPNPLEAAAWYRALRYSVFTNRWGDQFLGVEHVPSGRGLSFRLRLRHYEPETDSYSAVEWTPEKVVEACNHYAQEFRGWWHWSTGMGYAEAKRRLAAEERAQ